MPVKRHSESTILFDIVLHSTCLMLSYFIFEVCSVKALTLLLLISGGGGGGAYNRNNDFSSFIGRWAYKRGLGWGGGGGWGCL